MSKPYIKVTVDVTDELNRALKQFSGEAVLVGVPEDTAPRESGQINNATIMAINEYGSPAQNIPARPVVEIGIRNAKDQIADTLKLAAKQFFTNPQDTTYLERAGFVASSSIKKAINEQDSIAAPSESTLKARKAKGFTGTSALIVTGQLRNSITHVLTGLWAGVAAIQAKVSG